MHRSAALFLLVSLSLTVYGCIHDKLDVPLKHIDVSTPDFIPHEKRNLAVSNPQSIRIVADYTYLNTGNSIVKEYIQNQLMASAIAYYSATLNVDRATSNIKYSDTCGGFYAPSTLRTTGYTADLVILVTAEYSSETYLAYAMPCALEQSRSRPVVGMINFNYKYLKTATNIDLEENLITTIHEIAHVLGFSANLYEYWRDSNNDRFNPLGSAVINGREVQYIDAEPLTSKIKAYFNCDTAEGAYLENDGSSGSAGSHFERRVFFNEFMTASSIADSVISEFTLALLESTGWYKVTSYSMADTFFTWGKNKGCGFLKTKCMTSSTTAAFSEFCTPMQTQGCTYTARAIGFCGATSRYVDPELPSANNYFGDNVATVDSYGDNCPYFMGYSDGDCENPNNRGALTVEVYGLNSRCFTGTLTSSSSSRPRTGFCFSTTCASANGNPIVRLTIGSNTITCTAAGQVSVPGYNGQLECPDPATFCAKANPVYCERGCSGRGTCTNGVCVCPTGWGGADCGFRLYVDSCSRCSNQATKKACFGDSCACNPSSGICTGDALIGIGDGGVDRPDDSNYASILGIFSFRNVLVMIALMMLALA